MGVLHHLPSGCMHIFPATSHIGLQRVRPADRRRLLEFTGIVPPVILLMSQLMVFSWADRRIVPRCVAHRGCEERPACGWVFCDLKLWTSMNMSIEMPQLANHFPSFSYTSWCSSLFKKILRRENAKRVETHRGSTGSASLSVASVVATVLSPPHPMQSAPVCSRNLHQA